MAKRFITAVCCCLVSASLAVEYATFAAGCFWSVETAFRRVPGVRDTEVGYTGGEQPYATYEMVGTGRSGHAEAVRVLFDPSRVSYDDLLDLFFELHDPTQPDGQGHDRGSQYRSAVFYHTEAQREQAGRAKERHQRRQSDPIVTQVSPAGEWWVAERYHQQYLALNFGHSVEPGSLDPIQCYGDRGPVKQLTKLSDRAKSVLTGLKTSGKPDL